MEYTDYGCRRTTKNDLDFWKEIYSDPLVLDFMNSTPYIECYKEFWEYLNRVDRYVVYNKDETLKENQIGGFTIYDRREKEATFGVVTHPNYRGNGLGKIIMTFLFETAKDLGIKTLKADVYTENKASLALLRGTGFKEIVFLEKHL